VPCVVVFEVAPSDWSRVRVRRYRTRCPRRELETVSRATGGRTVYTELEESDADLARHQKWLAAIRRRDYFDAPGGHEAAVAVASCVEALARFESEALSAEFDEATPDSRPGLHAVEAHRLRRAGGRRPG
jgi:hypothetical protein